MNTSPEQPQPSTQIESIDLRTAGASAHEHRPFGTAPPTLFFKHNHRNPHQGRRMPCKP
jgi:hypothetical protein